MRVRQKLTARYCCVWGLGALCLLGWLGAAGGGYAFTGVKPVAKPYLAMRTQAAQEAQEGKEGDISKGPWRRFRTWITDADSRQRFASMGAAGVLSYGVVSNMNYIPLFAFAWYVVSTRSGVSPVHEWPAFLSTYAALYVVNNLLRPIKLVAVAFATPRVNRCFKWVMNKYGIGKKRAVAIVYIVLNTFTVLLMALSVLVASCLAGVPVW
ncbi:unnamed protein product [Effrenium voratum]|uniref:Uncharacterized protein n=1 Tax=Effrenium voratum TaxID=2562239 RepID=A0AA36JR15_9DINO|nr:unnamed protein product [Effrenium voratum]CAJ1435655.1 unnamed protein product [Effrenium voratum]